MFVGCSGNGPSAPAADWYADNDRHQFKIADSRENLLPTPELLARFRIKRVDKPDYYRWENDGALGLAGRRRIPPGIVVNTECRTLFPDRLPPDSLTHGNGRAAFTELPDELAAKFAALAAEWTAGVPRGWPQLDAVVRALRTGYEFDADARPPADHPHPVLWFLLEWRRGPAYLFATAAALLLRALDYPTRVCLGYYAAPERFALESRETVGPEDRVSGSTTKIALAEVRAAQGRDAEAVALFHEALEELAFYGFRAVERQMLGNAIEFFRERGRDDDVVRYEARLAELSASSTAPIV